MAIKASFQNDDENVNMTIYHCFRMVIKHRFRMEIQDRYRIGKVLNS